MINYIKSKGNIFSNYIKNYITYNNKKNNCSTNYSFTFKDFSLTVSNNTITYFENYHRIFDIIVDFEIIVRNVKLIQNKYYNILFIQCYNKIIILNIKYLKDNLRNNYDKRDIIILEKETNLFTKIKFNYKKIFKIILKNNSKDYFYITDIFYGKVKKVYNAGLNKFIIDNTNNFAINFDKQGNYIVVYDLNNYSYNRIVVDASPFEISNIYFFEGYQYIMIYSKITKIVYIIFYSYVGNNFEYKIIQKIFVKHNISEDFIVKYNKNNYLLYKDNSDSLVHIHRINLKGNKLILLSKQEDITEDKYLNYKKLIIN